MLQLATGMFWTGIGFLLYTLLPEGFSKPLARMLYWVGVPLQVFAFAHRSDFNQAPWLPPLTVSVALGLGLFAAVLCLWGLKNLKVLSLKARNKWPQDSDPPLPFFFLSVAERFAGLLKAKLTHLLGQSWPTQRPSRGSFVLSSMLGNTIFVGLSIIPSLVHANYLGWLILYGVGHSLLGSYGVGVMLASYFGHGQDQKNWSHYLFAILTVPALWGFALGLLSQPIPLPHGLESGLQGLCSMVSPGVFLLLGLQIRQFPVSNLQVALIPTFIKMFILPIVLGGGLTVLGIQGDARLSLVLMTGMPTSASNLILAQQYNLDSQLATGCILLSTLALPLMLPVWLTVFQ